MTVDRQVIETVERKMQSLHSEATTAAPAAPGTAGNSVELSIWDFAGQAVYYTTHQVRHLSGRLLHHTPSASSGKVKPPNEHHTRCKHM